MLSYSQVKHKTHVSLTIDAICSVKDEITSIADVTTIVITVNKSGRNLQFVYVMSVSST